jgi:hypothetical protein
MGLLEIDGNWLRVDNFVVRELMKKRKEFIDHDLIDSHEADMLMNSIREKVIALWEYLSVETIFEALTSIGGAPSLLYDDAGRFAVLDDGVQNVYNGEHSGFEGDWVGDISCWKPTVREAIGDYIKRLQGK